jgi:hypothetical protein
MTSLVSVVRNLGKLLDNLSQHCGGCNNKVFAKRIVGKYVREGNRILIWECPECHNLWQGSLRDKDLDIH